MSHTTTIDNVVFTDRKALEAAVADLNKMGVACDLIENTTARTYPGLPEGRVEQPLVLRLKNGSYDVAFVYDDVKKGLVAKADFYGGHIKGQLGAAVQKGESAQQAQMGKLFQAYAVQAATRQAVKQGYTVSKRMKADGTVQLVMTGMGT